MKITQNSASRPDCVAPISRAGALVFAALMSACPAVQSVGSNAAAGGGPDRPLRIAQASPSVSADQAAAVVRAASGGRILDVRLDSASRPPVYRVKVLLDGGRVRVYRVDAGDGRILQ